MTREPMIMGRPWYKDAILYGIDVATFADGNGDGIGDFRGLLGKLPYLAGLGVTCLWLLPFYPGPRRDNGYDLTNHYDVDPRLGSIADFIELVHEAGRLGIRILVDLVANHTSDQHPWFQAARLAPASRFRGYYVWTRQPPPGNANEKNVFPGLSSHVWAFDDAAQAYYFHRFYAFEPDLDLTHPEVRHEIRRIMELWLDLGASGFRVDGAALMILRKGLAETEPPDPQGVLADLHQTAVRSRADALLLGEVNESPDRIPPYFEQGKLRSLFNFWLSGWLFLALARESAEPVLHGLATLPPIPIEAQWVNFLRNLDELDVHQIGPEGQQAAMAAFAPDPGERAYGRGIRRRLAPILGGDHRRIALAFSLLFSMPGAPLFVYGDEIGMGDDPSRSGRDAVRAPMQWSAGPNAGFSSASAGRLVQPIVRDSRFGPARINVADQIGRPDSLLGRICALAHLRRRCPEIGDLAWSAVGTGDERVLGHAYAQGATRLFFLHNMSGAARGAAPRRHRRGAQPAVRADGKPDGAGRAGALRIPLVPIGPSLRPRIGRGAASPMERARATAAAPGPAHGPAPNPKYRAASVSQWERLQSLPVEATVFEKRNAF